MLKKRISGDPKVLLVDDDPSGIQIRAEMIRLERFIVNIACSPEEALGKSLI